MVLVYRSKVVVSIVFFSKCANGDLIRNLGIATHSKMYLRTFYHAKKNLRIFYHAKSSAIQMESKAILNNIETRKIIAKIYMLKINCCMFYKNEIDTLISSSYQTQLRVSKLIQPNYKIFLAFARFPQNCN